jgi:hypothetical protein
MSDDESELSFEDRLRLMKRTKQSKNIAAKPAKLNAELKSAPKAAAKPEIEEKKKKNKNACVEIIFESNL